MNLTEKKKKKKERSRTMEVGLGSLNIYFKICILNLFIYFSLDLFRDQLGKV